MTHAGEVYVQRRAGYTRAGLGSASVGVRLPLVARHFLAEQRLLVVGGRDDAGRIWVSPIVGPPGFVHADGERDIVVDARPGAADPLGDAFTPGAPIGAIALDPATRRRMRINGVARPHAGLRIEADQVFANCPKYIRPREVVAATPGSPAATRRTTLSQEDIGAVGNADTFFIATYAEGLGMDASHRGGEPGFVSVTAPDRLSWPDYRGNAMFMTLGNLHLDARCGLLFPDWSGTGTTLHLTGRASVDWDPQRTAATPGAERIIDFTVEQVAAVSGPGLQWRAI